MHFLLNDFLIETWSTTAPMEESVQLALGMPSHVSYTTAQIHAFGTQRVAPSMTSNRRVRSALLHSAQTHRRLLHRHRRRRRRLQRPTHLSS